MKLFGIFALAAVVVADFDYDSLGLKKPNKGSDAAAVDKVISCFWPECFVPLKRILPLSDSAIRWKNEHVLFFFI